ncbi:MAG TPA: serine hydrolase, partial [Firmicutes bacterium]|nr:serine hydrolase [Bacillota bacterium]
MKQTWTDYAKFVEDVMEREHIAGAAIAVAQHGSVLFQKGFGYRDVEQQLPVTPDTIFGVASVSKSFTAMAIMQLADAGVLSVNDPVVKYLPELRLRGVDDLENI